MNNFKTIEASGLPRPVPQHDAQNDNAESELEHGSHGVQGGEKGNEYQALWMTLACINAIHQPNTEPVRLSKIILEGSREPFDDIEIVKSDGSLTLFQSKHRHKAGSNNILISELVKIPGGKDSAPFSLLKYFKGMMSIKANSGFNDIRFIIGVSAPFSESFELPSKKNEKKRMFNLGKNFWSSSGVLQTVQSHNLEPLLSKVYYSQTQTQDLKQCCSNSSPQYVRFSDKFIENDESLSEKSKVLRRFIIFALKEFIKDERNNESAWVDWKEKFDDKKIKFFFKNLQLWIKQPKVDELRDIVLKSLRINFVMNANEIQQSLVDMLRQTADRHKKSLRLADVAQYLQEVRGNVLLRYLGAMSDQLRTNLLFDKFIQAKPRLNLAEFLGSKSKILVLEGYCPGELKYFVYSEIHQFYHQNYPDQRFGENWLLVDYATKPIYQFDPLTQAGEDYEPQDVFNSQSLNLLVLDRAESFFENAYGKSILSNLITRLMSHNKIKLILISSVSPKQNWIHYFDEIKFKSSIVGKEDDLFLCNEEISQIITTAGLTEKTVEFFDNQFIKFSELQKGLYPSLYKAMAVPSILLQVITSNRPSQFDRPLQGPGILHVPHFQALSISVSRPVYQLRSLCEATGIKRIRFLSEDKNIEGFLQKYTKKKWSFDGKNKRFYVNLTKEGVIVEVKSSGDVSEQVIVDKIDERSTIFYPAITPCHFDDKLESTGAMNALIMKKEFQQKTLLVADYGSGKSSLLQHLLNLWFIPAKRDENYEWVVLLKIPEIVRKIKKQLGWIEIIEAQAKKQGLIKDQLQAWQKQTLLIAIQSGGLLLLLDGLDEVKVDEATILDQWLQGLPATVNFIIGTRPHAQRNLTVSYTDKISLKLFDWGLIQQYIISFFQNLYEEISDNSDETKHYNEMFIVQVLNWIGNGDNKEANEILQRPLHVSLFCEAIKSSYQEWMIAEAEQKTELQNGSPWQGSIFYRTKLYQLVIMQQLKKYLLQTVHVQTPGYANNDSHVLMLTQLLQIRLREIAFQQSFGQEPIKLVHYFDTKLLDQELYAVGFIAAVDEAEQTETAIVFIHRIMLEFFTAQYLLAGLTRGENDSYFHQVKALIDSGHNNPKYEQIWRVLGEMVRYGDIFLNIEAAGKTADIFHVDQFRALNDNDLIKSNRRFFRNCVNGLEYTDPIQSEVYNYRGWFHPIYPPNSTLLPVDISKYEGSDVNTVLLKEAKQNKGAALEIIKYLIEKKLLSDNWLLHFYDKREYEDLAEITNQNQEYDLALFRQLILKHNWLELGWNGFWDIDVYLPALKYMKQLSPVAAAYFIHRVENRNHIYYDMGVAAIVRSILFQLAKVELEVCPNRWFLLMVQTWLRKHGLINEQAPIAIIPQLLLKSWDGFLKDKQYPWIGIDALYSLAFVFKTPIFLQGTKSGHQIVIILPAVDDKKTQLTLNVPPEQTAYLIDRIKYLRKKSDFIEMKLPAIQWDSSEFDNRPKKVSDVKISALIAKFNPLIYTKNVAQFEVAVQENNINNNNGI